MTVVSAVVTWSFYPKSRVYDESFEDFGGRIEDADLPLDPNDPKHPVAWNISRVTSVVHSGGYSLEFSVDGRQDERTV